MNPEDRAWLMAEVRAAIDKFGRDYVADAIQHAHNGRPDDIVVRPESNMHLFRQYRNSVSASADQLIDEAEAGRG